MKISALIKLLIIVVLILSTTTVFAFRTSSPQRISTFDDKAIIVINNALEQMWNLSNGRFNLDVVTVNPDGNTKGDIGDMLLFNNSGTYYLEINVTGAKVWRGVLLQDLP